ncbi:MAG: zinc-dependent metalloprotease [Mariniblastus sp.]
MAFETTEGKKSRELDDSPLKLYSNIFGLETSPMYDSFLRLQRGGPRPHHVSQWQNRFSNDADSNFDIQTDLRQSFCLLEFARKQNMNFAQQSLRFLIILTVALASKILFQLDTTLAAGEPSATNNTLATSVANIRTISNSNVDAIPDIDGFVKDMKRHDGFIPFYWDESTGKVHLEISRLGSEFLYVNSLATGLGSNPVGLDRGQLGGQRIVHFKRVGPKVLLVQRNLRFRAETSNELERTAVEQSFAQSIIWGGKIVAQSNDTVIVDVTDWILDDIHGVVGKLKRSKQGDFSLDKKRSAVHLPRCKAFPKNTELESTLTFSSKNPGAYVKETTPTSASVTLRQHHSFVELPDDDYQPRKYDVRSPCISITYADYATALDQPLEKRLITRHRLKKKTPDAALSEPVEPIIYYVDAGAPKQIQEALVEGASWWNDAFESAGFKDAFQVKLLPADADPLDVRYNVIQWVHRSTRGWSYGGSVIDPRTGEIIKGHVTLGSLRVRQDQLLINSLDSNSIVSANGSQCACCGIAGIAEETTLADMAVRGSALDVSLARIRQLSAHEVGHTIGFVHNFAASTYGDRASVMDYPAPRVILTDDGKLDLSDAYGVGIGEWDKVSVQFAYSEFPAAKEADGLNQILAEAKSKKMLFISDADARPAGAAHPLANLWDNGTNPLDEFFHVIRVRRIALDQFDPTKLPKGTTTHDIAQYLTPVYLHHRYQIQAVGKLIGGYIYEYGYVGDDIAPSQAVETVIQREAVKELINSISPDQLIIKPDILKTISPRPYSSIRDQEILRSRMGRIFDPLAAASVAVNLTLDELLQHERLNRLSKQDTVALTPREIVDDLMDRYWGELPKSKPKAQLVQVVREAILDHLMKLADNPKADVSVRTAAYDAIRTVFNRNGSEVMPPRLNRQIRQFMNRSFPALPEGKRQDVPPGSPIGSTDR